MYEILKIDTKKYTQGVVKYKTTADSEVSFTLSKSERNLADLVSVFATNGLSIGLHDELGEKELGVQFYITDKVMSYLKIEPVDEPDTESYINLLRMLGITNIFEVVAWNIPAASGTKHIQSDYFGARIPLISYFEPNKIVGGISKSSPITKKREGRDYVDSENVYSNSYNVRRGWSMTCRVSQAWLDGFDGFCSVYEKNDKLSFESGGVYIGKYNNQYTLLLHEKNDTTLIYDTIMLFETSINLLR